MTKKLEELTSEQETLMEVVANEWIDIALGKTVYDEAKIVGGVKWMYALVGLKEPTVLVVDSPLACQLVANSVKVGDKVWKKVKEKVRDKVKEKVRDKVWEKVGEKVGDKVKEKVRDKVWEKVGEKVGNKVWEKVKEKVREKNLTFFGFSTDNLALCAGWISFYDFFEKIGVLEHKEFSTYKENLKAGNFMSIYLDGLAIISLPPQRVEWNGNNLHSINGPAILFRDGWELFYINDVEFDEKLYWKIIKKELSAKEAIELQNIEQRTIALEQLGYENVLRELQGKVLDEKTHPIFLNKTEQVIEIELKDDTVFALFFKFVDASTGKSGMLRINPREIKEKTCKACAAWTFGLTEEEYVLEIES